jgi:copper resistance protein B
MNVNAAESSDELRNPNDYSDGYSLHDLPFHAGHSDIYRAGFIADRLEITNMSTDPTMTYDAQAWFGKTYDRVLLRAEGDVKNGQSQNARSELLWSHAITPFWDSHLGLRNDSGSGINREWLSLGVQGYAPYWIYVEATSYVNEQGRTAFRLELEYDLLITQRIILQPRIEANAYGRNDTSHYLGNGLSTLETGLRLRYEFRPEFAPYIGIDWDNTFVSTAIYAKQRNMNTNNTTLVLGVHFWF